MLEDDFEEVLEAEDDLDIEEDFGVTDLDLDVDVSELGVATGDVTGCFFTARDNV